MIRFIDIDPQMDELPVHSQEGHHRCPSSLYTKGRERLDIKTLVKKGDGKYFGGHLSSLTSSSMESNLNHRLQPNGILEKWNVGFIDINCFL
jgi:hypothetical protein